MMRSSITRSLFPSVTLLSALIHVCATGVSIGADAWVSFQLLKMNIYPVQDCECLKRMFPQYSDRFNRLISASKQGETSQFGVEIKVCATDDDDEATAATLYKPDGTCISMPWNADEQRFSFNSWDKPSVSLQEFAADFPSGEYRIDVAFVSGVMQSWYRIVPAHNTMPFTDIPKAAIGRYAGQLILDWSVAEGADYNITVESLEDQSEVFRQDFCFSDTRTERTPLGIHALEGDYQVELSRPGNWDGDIEFSTHAILFSLKNQAAVVMHWNERVPFDYNPAKPFQPEYNSKVAKAPFRTGLGDQEAIKIGLEGLFVDAGVFNIVVLDSIPPGDAPPTDEPNAVNMYFLDETLGDPYGVFVVGFATAAGQDPMPDRHNTKDLAYVLMTKPAFMVMPQGSAKRPPLVTAMSFAHEVGHTFGLTHTTMNGDIMNIKGFPDGWTGFINQKACLPPEEVSFWGYTEHNTVYHLRRWVGRGFAADLGECEPGDYDQDPNVLGESGSLMIWELPGEKGSSL